MFFRFFNLDFATMAALDSMAIASNAIDENSDMASALMK